MRESANERLDLARPGPRPAAKRADRIAEVRVPAGRDPQPVVIQPIAEQVLLPGVVVDLGRLRAEPDLVVAAQQRPKGDARLAHGGGNFRRSLDGLMWTRRDGRARRAYILRG